MKYYKYLDLNWLPARDKILEILKKEPWLSSPLVPLTSGSWTDRTNRFMQVNEIHTMVEPLNINIDQIALYVTNGNSSIHIDNTPGYFARIIFPILNCDNTETKFFISTEKPTKEEQRNGELFSSFDPTTCKHVDSFFLTQPAVFRVMEPHQVVMHHKNFPRISCILTFQQDINYLIEE